MHIIIGKCVHICYQLYLYFTSSISVMEIGHLSFFFEILPAFALNMLEVDCTIRAKYRKTMIFTRFAMFPYTPFITHKGTGHPKLLKIDGRCTR